MFTRIVVCLLLSVSLTAQDNNWQHHFYANYLLGMAETNETLWFATTNSILQYDKDKETVELLHFNNAPVARQILDIYQEGPETFVVLSGFNEISRWHAGQWSHEVLQPPGNISLRRIIGQATDGTYYLGDYTSIYKWNAEGEITNIPAITAANFPATQGAKIDKNGWMWLWRYNRLLVFNEDFEAMIDQVQTDNYINDLIIDKGNDNVWLLNSNTIDIWLAAEQSWAYFPLEDFPFTSTSRLFSIENNEALLGANNQLFKLNYSKASGLVAENIVAPADDINISLYGTIVDKQDRLWFFNSYSNQLTYWEEGVGFQFLQNNPWLPVSDVMSLGMDQQSKMWVAGLSQPAYFMGGRWHALPTPNGQIFSLQAGARDIVFTDQGYPVIGTGSLFSFGFPNSELMAWNGMNWDTVQGADFSSQFLVIREIELDENNNLWIMRSDDEFFSVKSQGEWYHYKTNDMPIDVDRFTCLTAGQNGQMWIGTNKGVISYDGFKYVGHDSTAIGLGEGTIRDIAVNKEGNVWLSLHTAGIRKWDGKEWTVELAAADLPINVGTNLLADDGKGGLWVTVDGEGLMHYDGKEWESFNTQNSALFDPYLTNIIVDKQGRLWCSNNQSISIYTPDKSWVEPFALSPEQQLVVFPNPGCCQFMAQWKAEHLGDDYHARLVNNLGQEVRRWSNTVSYIGEQFFTFSENDLSPGVYTLQLLYKGEPIASQQLIISY